jgi:peptidoglycan-associated lipoprotein
MRNLKIIGIILLIAITATSTFAQRKKIEKADNAFNTGRYFEAIDLYKFAYGKVDDKKLENELIFQTALCYRYIDEVRQAGIWFNKAIRRGIENPLAYLYHADALLASEEYEEAKQNYQEYKQHNKPVDRANEVWRAILQIRDAKL